MIYLGIDPDLHDTALALISEHGAVAVRIISSRGRTGAEAVTAMVDALHEQMPHWANELEALGIQDPGGCAIESQQVYRGAGEKVDPDDLIRVAQVAGACALAVRGLWPGCRIQMPLPKDWKQQQPKGVNQSRTLAKLKLEHACTKKVYSAKGAYCYVTKAPATFIGAGALNKGQWKHASDALGLALWVSSSVA